MVRARFCFDLRFAGCADSEFKIVRSYFPARQQLHLRAAKKIGRNLLGLAVILTYIETRPGNPPYGEPAGPCFCNFVVPRFAG